MPRLRMSRRTLSILSGVVTAALVAGLALILAGVGPLQRVEA